MKKRSGIIVQTIRLSARHGYTAKAASFIHTMLKLGCQSGSALKVVDDQIGNPTSADAVAALIARLLETPVPGVLHGSCEGEATWFQLAQAVFRHAGLTRELVPCATAEFPRPAPRPANSRLEKRVLRLSGLPPMPHWQEELENFISSLVH